MASPLFPVESEFPPATREFIARHIFSLEQLEVLLLLHSRADREWTAGEINEELRSQEASIAKWLESLASLGLVIRAETRYRFAPVTAELAQGTTALAEAYRKRRIKVIELIFSKPNENLLDFVRAFDLRNRP